MKTKFYSLMIAALMVHTFALAQFVRQYNPGTNTNLTFNCIAKAQDGNYFIAGIYISGKDSSVYVGEVTGTGAVVQEKLVGLTIVNNKAYRLNSMIVDADGNIVIVGLINVTGQPLKAFLMKLSPALSVLLHVRFACHGANLGLAFTDVKDFKTNSLSSAYYVSGYSGTASGPDAVLMKIDRNTGAGLDLYNGQPIAASTFSNTYDALLLDTAQTAAAPPYIYVAGPLNSGTATTIRPWVTRHSFGTALPFTKGERYQEDVKAQSGSLYNNNIIKDGANLLYCWYGNPTTASTTNHTTMGLSSVVEGSFAPVFQNQYTVSPAFQPYIVLTKVLADSKGYVTHGKWFDGVNEGGEIFLIRTDKNGTPGWARQYKNVLNDQSHNSSFIIDGPSIYAIGYEIIAGVRKGVLIKTDLATGSMDTACAKVLSVKTSELTYAAVDSVKRLDLGVVPTNDYYPINCIATDSTKPCDTCIAKALSCNTNFTITGQLIGNDTTFTVTASGFSTGCNSRFVVSQVNPVTPFADIPTTVLSVASWGATAPTLFPGYNGTTSAGLNTTGIFKAGFIYRVRHIISGTNNCGVQVIDTSSQLILQAAGLKAPSPRQFIILNEDRGGVNLSSYINNPGETTIDVPKNSGAAFAYPNPANTNVTFNISALSEPNMMLKIVNGNGQTIVMSSFAGKKQATVATSALANGLYLYSFTSNGKVVSQGKFVVLH